MYEIQDHFLSDNSLSAVNNNIEKVELLFNRLVDALPEKNIVDYFPGLVLTHRDLLMGQSVKTDDASLTGVKSIIFRLPADKAGILNLNRVILLKKNSYGDYDNIAPLAICSQSSPHPVNEDLQAGVSGKINRVNIHTAHEKGAWWRADFDVAQDIDEILFMHRRDKTAKRLVDMEIVAVFENGAEHIFYQKEHQDQLIQRLKTELLAGFSAIKSLMRLLRVEELKGVAVDLDKMSDLLNQAISHGFSDDKSGKSQQMQFAHQVMKTLVRVLEAPLAHSPDFGLSAGDGFAVKIDRKPVKYIRLRCYGKNVIGFAGLDIKGADDKSVKRFEMKELRLGYKPDPLSSLLAIKYGLVNKLNQKIVELDCEQDVEGLTLWNINAENAGTTTLTEIAVSTDSKNWHTVADTWLVKRQILAVLRIGELLLGLEKDESYFEAVGRLYTAYRLGPLLTAFLKQADKECKFVESVGRGAKLAGGNYNFAPAMMLTRHGLSVPLARRDPHIILNDMQTFAALMKEAGCDIFLAYGTLLGTIREKDFIPHDDDIDFSLILHGVSKDELLAEKERWVKKFQKLGLPVRPSAPSMTNVHFKIGATIMDLFFFGRSGGKIHMMMGTRGICSIDENLMLPLKKMDFKGAEFLGPCDPAGIMAARYGENWQIPDPYFEMRQPA